MENVSCYRLATIKGMLWHLRQDHINGTAEKSDEGTQLRCLVEDCLKSYKMQDSLARHMKECQPIVKVKKYERRRETEGMAAETEKKQEDAKEE